MLSPKRQQLLDAARVYLGTPFQHQGRSKHGIDCSGLVIQATGDTGLHPEDVQSQIPRYNARPNPRYFALMTRWLIEIPFEQAIPADIFLSRYQNRQFPQHMGFITAYPHGLSGLGLLHLSPLSSVARVVEQPLDQQWKDLILSIWRIPGIDDQVTEHPEY